MEKEKLEKILTDVKEDRIGVGDLVAEKEALDSIDCRDVRGIYSYQTAESAVEQMDKDQRFKELKEYVERAEGPIDLGTEDPELKEITKNLDSDIHRMLALEYIGFKKEALLEKEEKPKRKLCSANKEEKTIRRPGRISTWYQGEKSRTIARNLSLGSNFGTWDGETAVRVRTPNQEGTKIWNDWDMDWVDAEKAYLKERGESVEELKNYKELEEIANNFNTLLEADSKLQNLKEITGMNDEGLEDLFDVENLHRDFEEIKPVVDVMRNADYEKDGVYAKISSPSSIENDYPLPDHEAYVDTQWRLKKRSKAEKHYASGIKVVKDGEVLGAMINKPHRIYEDFKGGETRRYPRREVNDIIEVELSEDTLKIRYEDGRGEKREKDLEPVEEA